MLRQFFLIFRFVRIVPWLWFRFLNWRRLRIKNLDYIRFVLPAQMDSLPESRGWLRRRIQGDPPLSLSELDRAFLRIVDDPRPKGVILHLSALQMPMADLQSLCRSILRLREAGKQVICFALEYDTATYYLASAADQILLQPGGDLMTLGLRLETIYLKDALDSIGVQLEKVAVSPYKSAFDQAVRSKPTPESDAQMNWLLDSRYNLLIEAVAAGRGKSHDAVRAMIDSAPHLDYDALQAGWVDAVLNEEGIPSNLGTEHIVAWEKAKKVLLKKWRKRSAGYVALLPIRGVIVPGKSAQPPIDIPIPLIGSDRAGDRTVVQQVRQLQADQQARAVILYVDSPGGSAAASEAMTSALNELAKDRPLVVYMNNVAASGGYYVSTAGRWIVAQPGTITGSIGVITAKPTTQGLFEKLHANRVEYIRGANMSLQTDVAPYTPAQREQVQRMVNHLYDLFKRRVASSRNMTMDAVEAIAGGRVWTGEQALAHGLVDELGDLQTALKKARELANLPDDAPLVMPKFKEDIPLPPKLVVQPDPASALRYGYEGLRLIFNSRAQFLLPFVFRE